MRLTFTIIPLLAAPWLCVAQYALDWHTIDGGGGTSTGGGYSVTGTIGQPGAGLTLSGGDFTVVGGFWAVPTAVQVTNAPLLTIISSGNGQATISWAPKPAGFVLQETANLAQRDWVNSPSGATNPVVVPATIPGKFYRLTKP